MSIPLHLVTGFFGSGKTSFLKHYLDQFGGDKRIAIVQNEFSPVNIDGRELKLSDDYQILEVNNGSVFCVCLLGSFIDSLSSFIDDVKPDEIIMEASGMSDPIGVGQMFQSAKLRDKVYLGYVWAIVDVFNYHKLSALRTRLNHQLRVADAIVLNKIDLVDEDYDSVAEEVKKVNPFARILKTSFGKIDLSVMKKGLKFFPDLGKGSQGRPDLESVVIKSSKNISLKNLNSFLESLKPDILRGKGFVKLEEGDTAFVQGVFDEYEIRNIPDLSEPTELVLIGKFPDNIKFQLLFEEYCNESF
jgi:G3E family GTPase